MSKKGILGIVWSLCLIVIILIVYSIVDYNLSQGFASLATDQVNDDGMYYDLMRSRGKIQSLLYLLTGVPIVFIILSRYKKVKAELTKE